MAPWSGLCANQTKLAGETGSLLYMAPEVFRRHPYAPSADVFSWALLAWELVSGSALSSCAEDIGADTPREFAVEVR
jgi:serine/threonine protein kinase